ncbi:MAG: DNA primase [Candidatus Azobacteroides sp.]|nr:DNA primase [Candidatus Azobacteroides sp.]
MIDQFTIDKILQAAQIVDVVSDFVTLRRRGANYIGLCPFHNERTPSFSVSPAKGICKCFSCGKGGNAVHFIMEHEQMTYVEALKYLAKKYNIEVEEREMTDEEKELQNERQSLLIVNDFSSGYFQQMLFDHIEGKSVGLSYFKERGFREDIIRKFQLGYSLEQRDAFSQTALAKGYKKEYLLKTGLSVERDNGSLRDRFIGRVMFPIHTLSGKVVGFGGRILKKDEKTAKYVNSPESSVYHKSRELYGIYFAKQAIVKENRCFLVEGYTDVISMHQAGVANVVASSGTALTQGQINLIHRFTENITVLYDGDAAGIKASIRGIDLLLEEGMNVKVVLLPEGEDPDSFARQHSSTEFIEYIKEKETDFIRFKTNLLLAESGDDPIKRANLVSDIVRSISLIPNAIVRSMYVKECSSLMEVDEKVIYGELNKIFRNKMEKEVNNRRNSFHPTNSVPPKIPPPLSMVEEKEIPVAIPTKKSPYETFELTIIRYIVRYGEKICYEETNEETKEYFAENVIRFVSTELQLENIEFQNPVYKQIFEEAVKQVENESFEASRYFANHPDVKISRLASDLLNDRYQLSKIHTRMQKIEMEEDRLKELVPRAIMELKNEIVNEQIKQIRIRIKECKTDMDKLNTLLDRLNQLNQLKNALSKTLGERIILKL